MAKRDLPERARLRKGEQLPDGSTVFSASNLPSLLFSRALVVFSAVVATAINPTRTHVRTYIPIHTYIHIHKRNTRSYTTRGKSGDPRGRVTCTCTAHGERTCACVEGVEAMETLVKAMGLRLVKVCRQWAKPMKIRVCHIRMAMPGEVRHTLYLFEI